MRNLNLMRRITSVLHGVAIVVTLSAAVLSTQAVLAGNPHTPTLVNIAELNQLIGEPDRAVMRPTERSLRPVWAASIAWCPGSTPYVARRTAGRLETLPRWIWLPSGAPPPPPASS